MNGRQHKINQKITLELCQLTSKTTLSSQISNMFDGNKNKSLCKASDRPPVLKRRTLKT